MRRGMVNSKCAITSGNVQILSGTNTWLGNLTHTNILCIFDWNYLFIILNANWRTIGYCFQSNVYTNFTVVFFSTLALWGMRNKLNMVPKKISYLFYLWPVIMISQGWENLKIWKETSNCRTHIANDVNDKFCREFFHWNMWRAISEKKRFY